MDEIDDANGEAAREFMLEQYRILPGALAGILRSFIHGILGGKVPALLHCAAGKDRTGFGCAVLLTAVGASPAAIEEEYLRSNEHVDAARIRAIVEANTEQRISWSTATALTCRHEYLRCAVAAAAARHGSFDGYLEHDVALTAAHRRELQRLLLARG
jgi:protein-tyrosine phosphatase